MLGSSAERSDGPDLGVGSKCGAGVGESGVGELWGVRPADELECEQGHKVSRVRIPFEACLTQKQGEERVGDGSGRREPWWRQEFPGPPRADTPPPPAGGAAGAVPPAWSWARPEGTLLHVVATGLGLRGTHFEKRCATCTRHPGEGAPASAQQPGLASGTGHVLLRTGVASTVHKLSDGAPRALATPGPAARGAGRTLPPGFPPRSGGACCVVPPSRLGSRRGISGVAVLSPSRMGVGRRVPRSAGGRGSAGLGGASDSRVHPTIGSPHLRRGLSL